MFLFGLFCFWGIIVRAVIEFLFLRTIVWRLGKNIEGSIVVEEGRVFKVNIEGFFGIYFGLGYFFDLR